MDQINNLMALLQGGAPGMRGLQGGPIPPQNPTPGFRAPATGGMSAPQMQPQGGGGNMASGIAGLADAMSRLKADPMQQAERQRTAGDADLGGYSKAQPGGMFQMPDGTWVQNPNDPASYSAGTAGALGASGTQPGGMSSLWSSLKGLF